MSTSLSNISISPPISSRRDASAAASLSQVGFSHLKVRSHGRSLNAMAAERRENLDLLQKANSRQPTQAKQKMAQVTPVGNEPITFFLVYAFSSDHLEYL